MSPSEIVPDDAKEEFWAVVRDCLREFHAMSAEVARRKAGQLRKKIENMPAEAALYFYHSEPFDVACSIANNPLDQESYHEAYLRIRDEKHGPKPAEQVMRRPTKAATS